MSFECPGCGDTVEHLEGDDDEWTHVSVTRHNQDAADFAISACAECAADVVDQLAAWADDHWFQDGEEGDAS